MPLQEEVGKRADQKSGCAQTFNTELHTTGRNETSLAGIRVGVDRTKQGRKRPQTGKCSGEH